MKIYESNIYKQSMCAPTLKNNLVTIFMFNVIIFYSDICDSYTFCKNKFVFLFEPLLLLQL